jgi:hypothetical protein
MPDQSTPVNLIAPMIIQGIAQNNIHEALEAYGGFGHLMPMNDGMLVKNAFRKYFTTNERILMNNLGMLQDFSFVFADNTDDPTYKVICRHITRKLTV